VYDLVFVGTLVAKLLKDNDVDFLLLAAFLELKQLAFVDLAVLAEGAHVVSGQSEIPGGVRVVRTTLLKICVDFNSYMGGVELNYE
jgi:FKBP-type peptidyl-prolyl cis-trans isomerase 2